MESKLRDSGNDYLGLGSIDLQTLQPSNCTLQCESRKRVTSGEETQIATVASAGWLSSLIPAPSPTPIFFFFSFPPLLGEVWLAPGSGIGCCPSATLRDCTPRGGAWLCSRNRWPGYLKPSPGPPHVVLPGELLRTDNSF